MVNLRDGTFACWRDLARAQLEDARQHEFLDWLAFAGAMSEVGKKAEVLDFVENYLFNSDKCIAVFA
jgi:hypothetical protein